MSNVVILAGGLGTRLRSEVPNLPKPMALVAGRPFLEILMQRCVNQGASGFVLSVGYRREAIIGHFGDNFKGISVKYSIEQELLGTGGGVLLALDLVGDDPNFLVLNGDTYLDVDFSDLMELHLFSKAGATLALVPQSSAGRYAGVKTDEHGRVLGFDDPSAKVVNGGVYAFSRQALLSLPCKAGDRVSLERDMLPELLRQGTRVVGLSCPGRFLDIGVPEDYRSAAQFLAG